MMSWSGWSSVERWIWLLTLAAVVGTLLAGADLATAGLVLLIGALVAFVPGRFLVEQAANRRRSGR